MNESLGKKEVKRKIVTDFRWRYGFYTYEFTFLNTYVVCAGFSGAINRYRCKYVCMCAIHIFLDTIQSDYKVARANTYTDTKLGVALGVAKIFYFEHLGERDFCSRCARNKYRWWNFKLCGDQSRTQTVEARWTGRRRCVRKYCGNGGGNQRNHIYRVRSKTCFRYWSIIVLRETWKYCDDLSKNQESLTRLNGFRNWSNKTYAEYTHSRYMRTNKRKGLTHMRWKFGELNN